jgi:Flp pilus assembly protein TadG
MNGTHQRSDLVLPLLARDKHGVAMIEFAFVAPVLIALYLGTFQLCDAISAYRKVTTTARTVADLTSQYSAVSDNDLDTILNSSTQVLAPYSPANAEITVTQVKIDNSGSPKVEWSRAKNTAALAENSDYTIPTSIKRPNSSLIIANIKFQYKPIAFSEYIGSIPFSDTIIMTPRAVASINKKAN